ncbi:MAG: NADPH dehydrogenase [Alphaproteobacteria bacterium]|nr:NADPH dehydrogenase [Alphaproteobacteria bacterium]
MQVFEKVSVKGVAIANRIVMPPMCLYIADSTGIANEFHFQHYGARAVGGVGLIIQEATAVNPNGRITNKDLGIYTSEQAEVLKNLVSYVKKLNPTTKIMVQLGHAGRKAENAADMVAPSSIKFNEKYAQPREMTLQDIENVKADFINAAKKAVEAGYDGVEIHAAHGYLLHQFLSGITNKRADNYGGSAENRVRILKEILTGIREFFPADKILSIRLSAVDYSNVEETLAESIDMVKQMENLVDMFHVSSGALTSVAPADYHLYQVDFARKIKQLTNKPVIAVGLITTLSEAEYVLQSKSADFIALGRELLRNPNWVLLNNNNVANAPTYYKRTFV